ncbi:ArsR/SmtB family transcription factor [Ulvibacter litoralis]|uniref:ArsR family transcriptional regulator n=1 Tax=Ulvibacter litoralis TaxID=227084 RepID=A0A1G7HKX0_9FLAO|nr:metalloregulator ArsR/SmtB family transcription factor [Ulvibacter litoralis]SDF00649.1 ArsR family transcriptional regulator [Ulvibacter litoralis]
MELKQIEKISKALSDSNRLKILQYMQQHQGKMECQEIGSFLDLTQPSISHHIKKLVEADLIQPQKEGRHYNYTIHAKTWEEYITSLTKM